MALTLLPTAKLYWDDPYKRSFETTVTEIVEGPKKSATIYLEGTCFYPTGGGQPNDTGTLNKKYDVIDVIQMKDGRVAHVTKQPFATIKDELNPGDKVTGEINWDRRVDFMESHTGQHMLSQAFERIHNTQTIGFHLTPDSLTIDLDNVDLDKEDLDAAERITNEAIQKDLTISADYFKTKEEALAIGIRAKEIPPGDSLIRVISIGDFDKCPCSGTHLKKSMEVKLIKILKVEKKGDKKLRLTFVCGVRAVRDYFNKTRILDQMVSSTSSGWTDLPKVLQTYKDQWSELKREKKKLETDLFGMKAASLWQKWNAANRILVAPGLQIHSVEHATGPYALLAEYDPTLSRDTSREYQKALTDAFNQVHCVVLLIGHVNPETLSVLVRCDQELEGLSAKDLLKNCLKAQGGGNDLMTEGIVKAPSKPAEIAATMIQSLVNFLLR